MQKAEGPGDTPEWKLKLGKLTPTARAFFALSLGVTPRTVCNWLNGSTSPNELTVQRIEKQLKKKADLGRPDLAKLKGVKA